jgi:putative MATE family efflux protein
MAASPGRTRGNAGFLEGSVESQVIRLSATMIMGFIAMTTGNLIEAIYLGQVGEAELAAIAFCFPVTMGMSGITRGIGVGAASLLAQVFGAGDRAAAARITSHCFMMVLIASAASGLLLYVSGRAIFELLGATGEVLDLAVTYFEIWLLALPTFFIALVSLGIIRALGNVTYPGIIMSTGPVVQVIIGPALIFGQLGFPELGIRGAAWAYVIGTLCQLAIVFYWFVIRERLISPDLTNFLRSCRDILQVGIPAVATNLIQPLSGAAITWMLAAHGVLVVAGFGVASRVESMLAMVVIGIGTSIVPMVGQNWGAGKFDRVHRALQFCYQLAAAWGLIAAVSLALGGEFLIGLINDDPSLVTAAMMYLLIHPISIAFMGWQQIANHGFNALRLPMPALVLSLGRLIVTVLVAWIAGQFYGFVGIFAATAAGNLIFGLVSWRWHEQVLAREQAAREAAGRQRNEDRQSQDPAQH